MQNYRESEANYNQAVKVAEQHANTSDIDAGNIAEAYYRLGEIRYRRFTDIKLDAPNEKAMGNLVKDKTKALEDPAKYFAKAIEIGVEEWTMRATYMIGRGFYDMAEAVANQKLFGNETERMAGKIKVLSSLEKYYERAMQYFGQNIEWAKDQNLSGEYIEMSMQAMMEMAYKKGYILEEVGLLFKNSPIPKELKGDDREFYEMELEERYQKAREAAMPKYEEALNIAKEIGIGPSEWVDKIRERLREINAESEAINLQWAQWKPKERAKQFDADGNEIVPRGRDPEYDKNMRRIQSILAMDISVADKIKQLNRIQMEAERAIQIEQEIVNELKSKSGS
jgi:hypothetical protein